MMGVRISGSPVQFNLGDTSVRVMNTSLGEESVLMLEIREPVDANQLEIPADQRDSAGKFLQPLLRKYQAKLHEAASLLEGLITVSFKLEQPLPVFNVREISVNVSAETPEEQKLLDEGTVSRGFGHIHQPPKKIEIPWREDLLADLDTLKDQIPALSLLAQAVRSRGRGDEELAFVLFFKIIEGYFGDGTPRVKEALLRNAAGLATHLRYESELITAVTDALSVLRLPTRASNNFEGLITDLVLLRHKLAHFDAENAHRYFHPSLRFHLKEMNTYLLVASMKLIWEFTAKG